MRGGLCATAGDAIADAPAIAERMRRSTFDAFSNLVREALERRGIRVRGDISVCLDCPYDGPVPPEQVVAVAREMLAGEDARGNGTLVMAPDLSPTGMPTITLWRPDLPEELAQLFDAMVERDPAARPLAREVTDALATWCES